MKVRVVYRKDGGVSVMKHNPHSSLTPEEFYEKTIEGEPDLQDCECSDIDESEVPQDRKYRSAWRKPNSGPGIVIDLTKKLAVDDGELPIGGATELEAN